MIKTVLALATILAPTLAFAGCNGPDTYVLTLGCLTKGDHGILTTNTVKFKRTATCEWVHDGTAQTLLLGAYDNISTAEIPVPDGFTAITKRKPDKTYGLPISCASSKHTPALDGATLVVTPPAIPPGGAAQRAQVVITGLEDTDFAIATLAFKDGEGKYQTNGVK
ncbi:hypothetical protein QL374_003667 [Salmonella enterica]|nr:hypothetical protein [Salmonella enterica]ELW6563317.1 hypothetical protein [Salmonella enterica]ELZ1404536.1 hypothetical protein [Salmonella enterica]